ncbi:hypothetical protein [Microvirga sp. TS319]|uniref:DUF6894 family protein n=1 Tax=Microvirga sp. TS319 TaxID=3241165 RepID=UPI00351A7072
MLCLSEHFEGIVMQSLQSQNSKLRCFFHLVNGQQAVLDEIGITVSNLEDAKAEALMAINELRRESEGTSNDDWKGWMLNVVCLEGNLLYSLNLDSDMRGDG